LTRQDTGNKGTDFPSHQYQLNEIFMTEDEADDFAVQKAMEWITKKLKVEKADQFCTCGSISNGTTG